MPTDNPYPPPSPLVLADMLAMHAWSDHLDDHSRKLLEWSADTIRCRRHRRPFFTASFLHGLDTANWRTTALVSRK
jgi:hypothetical protein